MRVLVCGGREFRDWEWMFQTLDRLSKNLGGIEMIVHGAAPGADSWADTWAKDRGIEVKPEEADWSNISHPDAVIRYHPNGEPYDAKAGHRRNRLMLDKWEPDLVVAFPGGKGTSGMVKLAKDAGVPVEYPATIGGS